MSPYLALVAGLVIALVAMRTARRTARTTELRLLTGRLARQARDDLDRHTALPRNMAPWAVDARAADDEARRRARPGARPAPYTPEQARAAKRAMAPGFGVRIEVRP